MTVTTVIEPRTMTHCQRFKMDKWLRDPQLERTGDRNQHGVPADVDASTRWSGVDPVRRWRRPNSTCAPAVGEK